jgi:hypothetical protein
VDSRTTLTASITSSLFGLYVLYALLTNSMIGVQTMETAKPHSHPAPEPPHEARFLARTFLAPEHSTDQSNAWILEADYQVRSKGAYLWYNEWEHKAYDRDDPNNSIEFSPFALLLKQDQKRHPLTFTSDTARIKFARPFDLKNPDAGRAVAGALQGPVRITGPGGLLIKGRDFNYSEDAQRIWSDFPVKFWHGSNYGEADAIQIDVEIDPDAIARDEFAISGIRNLKLRKVRNDIVLLHRSESEPRERPVEIRCAGTLDFDTTTHVARFWKDVRVIRPTGPRDQRDLLTCDLLTVTSRVMPEEDSPDAPPPATATEGTTATEAETDKRGSLFTVPRNLKPVRIKAESDGEAPVVLHSEQQSLLARMDQFLYEVEERTAHLTHPQNAVVTHAETVFAGPEITIVHDEHNELESLVCRGAGEMQYIPQETDRLELQARWMSELRVAPEASTGLMLIELDRDAVITQPIEESSLRGDHIRLWVAQPPGDREPVAASGDQRLPGLRGRDLTPHKMLVLGNVQFSSPELAGTTERLSLTFSNEAAPSAKDGARGGARNGAGSGAGRMSLLPSGGSRERGQRRGDRMNSPARLEADEIEIVVRQGEELSDSWVETVTTSGDVVLTQPQNPLEPPLVMKGDRVEVLNADPSNLHQVVHVYGQPARIEDREMRLVGNQLHLDRKSNRAWVTGPGVMQSLVDSDLEGNKLAEPQILSVWWREKMEFDGRTASFYDQVRTTLDESSLLCQEMEVVLARRIDFATRRDPLPAGKRDETNIERLHCKYGVKVESRQAADGKLTELRSGEFGELTFQQTTGGTVARGPGILRIWRAGTPNRGGLARGNEALTNTAMHTRETGWNFTQVEFAGNVVGNLNTKITSFQDRVRIIFGPVSEPGELLNPDALPAQGGWMTSEKLEITLHPKTETEAGWFTMRAEGNVDLEGFNFFAQADLVTYDESRKTYRMRAFGKRKAKISLQEHAGREPLDTEAQSIEYRPEQAHLKADGVTMFIGASNPRPVSPK